jgi:GTP-binding protein
MAISAHSGQGIDTMLYEVKKAVKKARAKAEKKAEKQGLPVITLADTSGQWRVSKEDGKFVISGSRIEQFARRTDFSNPEAVQRLRDIMKKMGIMHELERQGILPGHKLTVGSHSIDY